MGSKRMRSNNQSRSLLAFRGGFLASSEACWNLCCRVLLPCLTGRVSCFCALRVRAAPLRLIAPARPPINRSLLPTVGPVWMEQINIPGCTRRNSRCASFRLTWSKPRDRTCSNMDDLTILYRYFPVAAAINTIERRQFRVGRILELLPDLFTDINVLLFSTIAWILPIGWLK
jgi:hypothetical protein